ncbi:MAG: ABC transporter permease [Anaerolineae bacterium]|jgi:ABC-2 type transport system permease protein
MNAIRNTLRMARKDLKLFFKDRGQLAILFVLPLVFALMLGATALPLRDPVRTGGESSLFIRAYILNEDQGPYGAQVEDVLRSIQSLRLLHARTAGGADEKVAAGEAPAAIIIPADFSARIDANQPARVQLIKDPMRQAEAQAVAGILNEVLTELSVRAEIEYGIRAVYAKAGTLEGADPAAARAAQAQTMGAIWTAVQEIRRNPAIAVQREDLVGEERVVTPSGVAFACIMPAFATMFAFFLIGTMAESILGEKEAGSFRRLLAAPMHPGTVVAGKMLAYIGVVFLQMVVLLGICAALLQMPLGRSPLGLVVLTLALALAATGLGMLLGAVAQTPKQAGSMGLLLGFVLAFASGFIPMPIRITGGVAEVSLPSEGLGFYASQLTPHVHAYNAYLKLLLDGAGLADIWPNVVVLFGFGVVFLLLGLWRFKFE